VNARGGYENAELPVSQPGDKSSRYLSHPNCQIGTAASDILADSALEAKCKNPERGSFRTLCVLYSELADPDWPDELRVETGALIYYGDNKRPGHELHDTQRSGNLILRNLFEDLPQSEQDRSFAYLHLHQGHQRAGLVFRGCAGDLVKMMGGNVIQHLEMRGTFRW
jgi:Restriction endonuclease AspBHI N-terminal